MSDFAPQNVEGQQLQEVERRLVEENPQGIEEQTSLICRLPRVTGPCRAAIKRYYYNFGAKRCQTFTYGGCGGNANNFRTLRDCEAKCKPSTVFLLCFVVENLCFWNVPSGSPFCRRRMIGTGLSVWSEHNP